MTSGQLCERLDDGGEGSWHDALREMAKTICAQMPSARRPLDRDDLVDWHRRTAPAARVPLPTDTLEQIFLLLWRFNMEREADAAVSLFTERPDLVPPDRTIPAHMEPLSKEHGEPFRANAAFSALWRHGADFLLSRSKLPLQPPTDWIISAEGLSCDCEHCVELRRFCADPDSEVLRMPVRKELRGHLRRRIEQGGIDIDSKIERRGRPYTLVCVKTRGAFKRRLRQYQDDIEGMRRMARTAEPIPGSADIA